VVSGNAAVVLASELRPLAAITLSEVLATSDVPGGVVNLLTGHVAEVAPWLAAHMDVNAIDVAGVDDVDLRRELEVAAADNVKRVRRPDTDDWTADPGLSRIRSFLETKTVWHPIGV
jgi:acyl-CoA reductase-like NAD-dependent aldehyde dehydrogenase